MRFFAYEKIEARRRYEGVQFYISGADMPGEGELKIFDIINLRSTAGTEESFVIVGGDADLVLQGLALPKVKNLFLYVSGRGGEGTMISLWEVVRELERAFPGQSEYLRADLIFLLVLNGNDYLPKVRGISFNRCFQQYKHLKA
ncbi:unnamed protein product, partial [Phaeothamnion confervicola]